MTQSDTISKEEILYEKAVLSMIDEIIKTIKEDSAEDKKIIDGLKKHRKERLQENINKFQAYLSEKLYSQKEHFISEFRKFCQASSSTKEEKVKFLTILIGKYALGIVQEEIKNKIIKGSIR